MTPRPVRVAYVLTYYPMVSQTFITEEIVRLEGQGVEIVPISINSPRAVDTLSERDRVEAARALFIKAQPKWRVLWWTMTLLLRHPSVLLIPLRPGGFDVKGYVWRGFQLVEAVVAYRWCRERDVRHLHAHFGQAPSTIAWFTAAVGNVCEPHRTWTWSVTIHGWHEFVNERDALLRQKVAAASFVVCISDYTRSQLMRIARPEDWWKLQVIRCGVDVERLAFEPHAEVGDPPTALMVARLSPEKGHVVLLEAIAGLRARGRKVQARFIGPAELGYDRFVYDTIDRLGIADLVRLDGPRSPEEVVTALAEADVFCLPTFAEGLPVSIMEAMATGVPVVTTYISGIPELAIDGETALVVQPGRPDLLADALARVLDDAALRARLVRAARARVEEQHDAGSNIPPLREALAGVGGG